MDQFRKIIALSNPVILLFSILTYYLGIGISRYLGTILNLEAQFLGGTLVLLFSIVSSLLTEYFRPLHEPLFFDETRKERLETRPVLLVVSVSLLAVAALLIYFLIRAKLIQVESGFFIAAIITLAMAKGVPPIRLVDRGWGELTSAILLSSFYPALAFILQYGSFHRLLTIFTIPLLFMAIAYFLAVNFKSYAEDIKFNRKSLLINLTWQRGIPIHNFMLAVSYLLFAGMPFWGVPFGLVWPALITMPAAAYQIFTLRNIGEGAKAPLDALVIMAVAIYGLTVYLVVLTFWLR